jgi:hypothetical protein
VPALVLVLVLALYGLLASSCFSTPAFAPSFSSDFFLSVCFSMCNNDGGGDDNDAGDDGSGGTDADRMVLPLLPLL